MEDIIRKLDTAIGLLAALSGQYEANSALNNEDNLAAHMGVEDLLRGIRDDLKAL